MSNILHKEESYDDFLVPLMLKYAFVFLFVNLILTILLYYYFQDYPKEMRIQITKTLLVMQKLNQIWFLVVIFRHPQGDITEKLLMLKMSVIEIIIFLIFYDYYYKITYYLVNGLVKFFEYSLPDFDLPKSMPSNLSDEEKGALIQANAQILNAIILGVFGIINVIVLHLISQKDKKQ